MPRVGSDPGDLAHLSAERGSDAVAAGGAQGLIDAAKDMPADERTRALELALAEAYAVRGDPEAALACLQRAANGAERLDAASAWRAIAVHFLRGDLDAAHDMVKRTDASAAEKASSGAIGTDDTDRDRALLHAWSGQVLRRLGDVPRAESEARAALEIARLARDDRALAAAHNIAGLVAGMSSDHAAADEHQRSALAAARRAADVFATVQVMNSAGWFDSAAYADGTANYERAAEIAETAGFTPLLARTRMNLGLIKWSVGLLDEAAREYADAVVLYRASGSREVAYAIIGKGDVHRERGEIALARAAYQEGLALGEASGDRQALVPALYQLAKVIVDDEPDEALRLARRAVDLGWPDMSWALNALGWIELARGDRAAALETAGRAGSAAREEHDRFGLAESLSLHAMASAEPATRQRLLEESGAAWRYLGNAVQGTLVALALARWATGARAQAAAEAAERRLQRMGVGLSRSGPAGLGRFVARDPAPVPVEIRVLGGFQVLRQGSPVPLGAWQSRKARDLLKILVTRRGRPIAREIIGETLWPEDDSEAVAARLSVALSTLRSVLDPDRRWPSDHFIAGDASAVSLRPENVRIDVDIFFANVDAALAAAGEDARDLLSAAEASYAGDLLEEDPHADWAVGVRERARAAYIRVVHALARHAAERGDHQDAVDLYLRVLERDPYDERAHSGLIRALQADGRHGEARRAHAAYVSRMADIGVKASPLPAP